MQFYEKLNGICPLCGNDLTVAEKDYWGCSEYHFFVELDKMGFVSQITIYAERPAVCNSTIEDFKIIILPQKHIAHITPTDQPGIRMPLLNEDIMFSFLTNKVFRKCETMMLLK